MLVALKVLVCYFFVISLYFFVNNSTVVEVYLFQTYTKFMYETSNLYIYMYFRITGFKKTGLLVLKI